MASERSASATETSPLLEQSGITSTETIISNGILGEYHPSDEEQAKDAVHDAQKQLRYIIPAISIGVRLQSYPPKACHLVSSRHRRLHMAG